MSSDDEKLPAVESPAAKHTAAKSSDNGDTSMEHMNDGPTAGPRYRKLTNGEKWELCNIFRQHAPKNMAIGTFLRSELSTSLVTGTRCEVQKFQNWLTLYDKGLIQRGDTGYRQPRKRSTNSSQAPTAITKINLKLPHDPLPGTIMSTGTNYAVIDCSRSIRDVKGMRLAALNKWKELQSFAASTYYKKDKNKPGYELPHIPGYPSLESVKNSTVMDLWEEKDPIIQGRFQEIWKVNPTDGQRYQINLDQRWYMEHVRQNLSHQEPWLPAVSYLAAGRKVAQIGESVMLCLPSDKNSHQHWHCTTNCDIVVLLSLQDNQQLGGTEISQGPKSNVSEVIHCKEAQGLVLTSECWHRWMANTSAQEQLTLVLTYTYVNDDRKYNFLPPDFSHYPRLIPPAQLPVAGFLLPVADFLLPQHK